jgi:hypothetical protein
MTNEEIDSAFEAVERIYNIVHKADCLTDDTIVKVNANMLIASMLAEIAKRLPEPKDPS